MSKLKVGKKLKDQLDELFIDFGNGEKKSNIVEFHIKGNWIYYNELNKLNLEQLLNALYEGYELDEKGI